VNYKIFIVVCCCSNRVKIPWELEYCSGTDI
jgi:hypothetical protein